MELKLNIYEGTKIIKTYTSAGYRLKMGTAEDILGLIDIDKFSGVELTDNAAIMEIVKIVLKARESFEPVIRDIFEGLTHEDYRAADVVEIAVVLWRVVQHTFNELTKAVTSKN